jgi:hypothetical protein
MNQRIVLSLAILLYFTSAAACHKQRQASRHLMPDGYVGWVKIYFKVANAPALPIEDGYYLFKFPASGVLQTSSAMEDGWAQDQYFYYSAETRRPLKVTGRDGDGLIWAGYNGEGGNVPPQASEFYEGFFVGTEAEYKDYGRYVDSEAPGPLDKAAIERKKKRDGIQ